MKGQIYRDEYVYYNICPYSEFLFSYNLQSPALDVIINYYTDYFAKMFLFWEKKKEQLCPGFKYI